jgi:dTDP-4-amino-4,6-dideoxygalactose transaminase
VPKTELNHLAVAGAPPAFERVLHVGQPNIGDRRVLMERLNDLLDRRWLTNDGTYVQRFERAMAETTGVRHCIATCNATVALQLAIRALELSGEVIVPAFTFVATVHALMWEQITPVFCDVDAETMMLDHALVARSITAETSAILPVHLWGRACNPSGVEELAKRHGLRLLFDAAHGFGSTTGGRAIGGFGDAEVFSFHATKFVNSFEGGAITTNNDELAERLRMMRNFGFAEEDRVLRLGINGKMHEASAAMGLTSIESADEFIRLNRQNFHIYQRHLRGIAGICLHEPGSAERSNCQYVVIQVQPEAGLTRDTLLTVLRAENVYARRYFFPGVHRMEPYRSMPRYSKMALPKTERLAAEVLCLPTGTCVGEEEVATICAIIRTAVNTARPLTKMLAKRQ